MNILDHNGNPIQHKTLSDKDRRIKNTLIELAQTTQNLTKKDIGTWRQAWQMAINVENPKRNQLLSVYDDVLIDNHLSGCIDQRRNTVLQKAFKIVDKAGKERPETTELFESEWFKNFCSLAIDSVYYGYSLVEFGDLIIGGRGMHFDHVEVVPRHHVIPEFGVVVKDASDDWQKGFNYKSGPLAKWCLGVGKPRDLGLLLKVSPQSIAKKNMMAFWDQFGELFGMPIRIAKTTSRDKNETSRIENMLQDMGAAAWGLFQEGTEIEIKESAKGDAFNVYDQRILRANSEISKAILNQTMTIDDGASLSQSQVHLTVFQNMISKDADMLRDVINGQLFPFLLQHGFPLEGLRFDWDETIDLSQAEQLQLESLLLNNYEIDPSYFVNKYNIPILSKKEESLRHRDPDFFA